MKNMRILTIVGLAAGLLPLVSAAADLVKANNTDALNLATSWTNNVAPTSTHRLIWNTLAATPASCTNTLGGSINALGLRVVDPAADVSITSSGAFGITLNGSGIDLSAANRDLAIALPSNASLVQNKDASWVVQSGRTVTLNSKVYIQNSTGTNLVTWTGGGAVRLAGGSGYPFNVANSVNATGTLVLANVSVFAGNPLTLCAGTNSVGTVYQTGGSVYLQGVDTPGYAVVLGDRNDCVGSYDLSGGALTVSTNLFIGPERQVTNVVSLFTVRGAGTATVLGDIWVGGYKGVSGTATLALRAGGALNVRSIRVDGTVVNGSTRVMFDGGVLSPTINTASFLSGLSQATLSANGAVIDTAGLSVSIRQVLEDAAGQAGRLVKLGAGTLTLTNAASTFSGAVIVSNGMLRVAANASLASTNWVISAGATNKFDSAMTLVGKNVTIDAGGSVTPGLLDVTGNLTLGGKLTVVNTGDRQKVAQCTGTLSGGFSESLLPRGCVLRTLGGNELWVIRIKGTCVRAL